MRYLLSLILLLAFSVDSIARERWPVAMNSVQLIQAVDKYEDSEHRQEIIREIESQLMKDDLTESNKALLQGTLNRLNLVGEYFEIDGKDLSGNDLCICFNEYQNKVVLVDFWFSSCPPCRAEIKKLIPIYNKRRDHFEIIGVNADRNNIDALRAKIELKFPWKSFRKTPEIQKLLKKYSINSFPRAILIGPDGKVVKLDVNSTNLEAEIEKLIK